MQAVNIKETRRAYEVYLKIAPDDAAALHNYGLVLLAENNPAKANAAPLRDAIHRAPTNANSYSALAVALIRTKDYTGAWNTLANGAYPSPRKHGHPHQPDPYAGVPQRCGRQETQEKIKESLIKMKLSDLCRFFPNKKTKRTHSRTMWRLCR